MLESDSLIFRGDFRLAIPFRRIEALELKPGRLTVGFAEGVADFDLGPLAEKWLFKIRNPRGLLDKLGVKPDLKVGVVNIQDQIFWKLLRERAGDLSQGRPKKDSDVIFLGAQRLADLARLETLKKLLKPNGAIWVVWPKGQQHIKQSDVMEASKAAGLVDVKVAAFSATHTALKLVIRVKARGRRS